MRYDQHGRRYRSSENICLESSLSKMRVGYVFHNPSKVPHCVAGRSSWNQHQIFSIQLLIATYCVISIIRPNRRYVKPRSLKIMKYRKVVKKWGGRDERQVVFASHYFLSSLPPVKPILRRGGGGIHQLPDPVKNRPELKVSHFAIPVSGGRNLRLHLPLREELRKQPPLPLATPP